MDRFLIALINIYQFTISPDHGVMRIVFPLGVCRFNPTCSEYTKQSIAHYGAIAGIKRGLMQLARCHPFARPLIREY